MPITNRDKNTNNTVVGKNVVPIVNQEATKIARGQSVNDTPHDGTTSNTNTSKLNKLVNIVNTASSTIGATVNAGISVVQAGVNLVGGVASAVSRGAAAISSAVSVITGTNSSKNSPVTAIQQVASKVSAGVLSNSAAIINSGLTALQLQNKTQLIDILLTRGTPTTNNEFKYRIVLRFDGKDKNPYDDVVAFISERFGFIKSCPLYLVKINLPPVLFGQLLQNQSLNKQTLVNLQIWQVDTENNNKLKTLIIQRNFEILLTREGKTASIEKSNSTTASLLLANPSLIQMDRQYTYNKIHNTKNAYDVLQDYQSYISSTYGNNFSFTDEDFIGKKNEYVYEQILTQPSDQEVKLPNRTKYSFLCKHDLDIPLFLNYKYKIDNAFSFYFFDDFDLTHDKEITGFFIALYDKNKFKPAVSNTNSQQDIAQQSQLIGSYQFKDIDGLLTPGNKVKTNKLINCEFDTKKEQSSSNIQSNTQVTGQLQIFGDSNRKINAQTTTETKHDIPVKQGQSTKQVPDSGNASNERDEAAHKVFNEKIDQIDCFTSKNCGFDYFQFGRIYPMNTKKPNVCLHTPIAIVNIFRRENDKESVLSHNAKTMMVKFTEDVPPEGNTQSKSSSSGQNSERDATKTAVNANKNNSQPSNPKTATEIKNSGGSAKVGETSGKSTVNTPTTDNISLSKSVSTSTPAVVGPQTNNPSKSSSTDFEVRSIPIKTEATMDDWA